MSKRKEEKKFNFATLSRSVPPSGEIEKRREKGEGKKKRIPTDKESLTGSRKSTIQVNN